MLVALASDHAGCRFRKSISEYLLQQGITVVKIEIPGDQTKVDYPDYARSVSIAVSCGEADFGILICGTGTGMAMVANRFKGIRAVSCTNEFMARLSRAHNDANILTLGERVIGEELALSIVDVFLKTPFEGGRHQSRLDKIDKV